MRASRRLVPAVLAALTLLAGGFTEAAPASASASNEFTSITPTSGPAGTVIRVHGTGWLGEQVPTVAQHWVCVWFQPDTAANQTNTCSQNGGQVVTINAKGIWNATVTARDLGGSYPQPGEVWALYYAPSLDAYGNFGQGPTFSITGPASTTLRAPTWTCPNLSAPGDFVNDASLAWRFAVARYPGAVSYRWTITGNLLHGGTRSTVRSTTGPEITIAASDPLRLDSPYDPAADMMGGSVNVTVVAEQRVQTSAPATVTFNAIFGAVPGPGSPFDC